MRRRKVRRLRGCHRIALRRVIGIILIPGLHICFSLLLLALRLLRRTILVIDACPGWRGISVVRALNPRLIGESHNSWRRLPCRGDLIGLLRGYYALRVQEVRLVERIRPRAVQMHLALPARTLGQRLPSLKRVVLLGLVKVRGGLLSDLRQTLLVVGRSVRDGLERRGVRVMHSKLVALR